MSERRNHLCDCGQPATIEKSSAKICKRCAQIEESRVKRDRTGAGRYSNDTYNVHRGAYRPE